MSQSWIPFLIVLKNVTKPEWNDWRRHLAMIVSNVDETNKDLVLNSVKTMGDTLGKFEFF